MSASSSIKDVLWHMKLYFGSFLLGGGLAAVLWPMYLAGFPDADLLQIFSIVETVFSRKPLQSWGMVLCSGGLFFWIVWGVVARPWRDGNERKKTVATIKKPW